eukprot:5529631-Amphidinium_carterae.1
MVVRGRQSRQSRGSLISWLRKQRLLAQLATECLRAVRYLSVELTFMVYFQMWKHQRNNS